MAARLPPFATIIATPFRSALRVWPGGRGADGYEGGIPLKISTEEVGRIIQAGRLNRTNLIGPKGYGRPVEPRNLARSRSAEAPNPDSEVQRVKALVEALPDVREDLVQALKTRVESGAYHVSSDDIADLMIRRTWADSMR